MGYLREQWTGEHLQPGPGTARSPDSPVPGQPGPGTNTTAQPAASAAGNSVHTGNRKQKYRPQTTRWQQINERDQAEWNTPHTTQHTLHTTHYTLHTTHHTPHKRHR